MNEEEEKKEKLSREAFSQPAINPSLAMALKVAGLKRQQTLLDPLLRIASAKILEKLAEHKIAPKEAMKQHNQALIESLYRTKYASKATIEKMVKELGFKLPPKKIKKKKIKKKQKKKR